MGKSAWRKIYGTWVTPAAVEVLVESGMQTVVTYIALRQVKVE